MKKGWRVVFLAFFIGAVVGCQAAGCGTAERADGGAGDAAEAGGVKDGGYEPDDAGGARAGTGHGSDDDDGAWYGSGRGPGDAGGAQGGIVCGTDQTDGAQDGNGPGAGGAAPKWRKMRPEGTLPLSWATQFQADFYAGGYSLITIAEGGRFLVVPEGQVVPEALDADITVLQQPLDRIYLVATSAMDFFRVLDGIGNIRLSGTDADGWYIEEAKDAIRRGEMLYAGKYSAPDYERIIGEGCDLAVESTMIGHAPEVKEQLERFDIPVLVERSSYESHPLGRMEWIKLYGLLLGKENEAAAFFEEQTSDIPNLSSVKGEKPRVAFFSINTKGIVTVRKSGDYVSKMIELAGGTYVFPNLGDDRALSTMNMEMERFYSGARDADIIIYNSTIGGELHSLEELLEKSGLLADFKAVKERRVYCVGQNLFQESTGCGQMIRDMNRIFTEESVSGEELTYLYPLR